MESNKTWKSVETLLVDDHPTLTEIKLRGFKEYEFLLTNAKSIRELSEKLQEGSYQVAFVDFDLGESNWLSDAYKSLSLINENQPSCIRIGITCAKKYVDESLSSLCHELLDLSKEEDRIRLPEILKKYNL